MGRFASSYLVAALLAVSFLGLAFTGLHMGFVIPADINALWGVSHRWWARVHLFLGLAFMALATFHFALHWGWLTATSRRSRLRSVRGWSLAVLGAASLTVYLGLRLAPSRARVAATTGLGRRVYLTQECDLCHRIDGVGGTIGPDLTHVGSRRSPKWLAEQITDPSAHTPNSRMPAHELSARQHDALTRYLAGLK